MNKSIGLIQVDSRNFPNIALMKLSSWHKHQGDTVEFYNPFKHYDIVYCSKVFSFTPDWIYPINADLVVKGGSGYAMKGAGGEDYDQKKDMPLCAEIEHQYPDYDIYGITNTAYGFLTRGCPRGCDFCIVGKKEGKCSRMVAKLNEFWHGQKNIVLCDPNILACKDWYILLKQLADSKAYIDFNQGLDARLLTKEKCEMLNRCQIKEIHFAWDRYEDKESILPNLEMYAATNTKKLHGHHAIVYVLVNHGTTIEEDLERIYTLRDLGFWAYVMVYDKPNAPEIYKRMQRWVNNRFVFAQCKNFEDYKRTTRRITNQQELFE